MSGGPYVKPKLAIQQLGVDRRTLKLWAESGYIKYIQPGGKGQRLYDVTSVGNSETQQGENTSAPQLVDAIYCRVSTRKQLPDLERQKEALKKSHPDHVIFSDCASGLNFKRKGFKALLQLAFERRLRIVRVANKDRLCRFAYDLVEHILEKHGAKIVVEAHDSHSVEQELAEDVLSIITVFGARLYGSRSGRKRRQQEQEEAENCGAGGAGAIIDDGRREGSAGGTDRKEDTIQATGSLDWASADLQGVNAPDTVAGLGVETVFLGRPPRVQPDGSAHKKRRSN